ncbi:unnamed protein product, partial [Prorocentrum cordatum]
MLHQSYDAMNAFACGERNQLEVCAHDWLAEDEEIADDDIRLATHISSTRRGNLTVILDAADERVAVRSGRGGFMGDTSDTQNYQNAVRAWVSFERRQGAESMAITFGRFAAIDASMGTLMADIFKTEIIPKDMVSAMDIVVVSTRNDLHLDQSLAAREHAHNRSKQDAAPALRSRQLTRQVIAGLRNSGCQAGYEPNNANELEARIQALNRGWLMAKALWHSNAPERVKRLMFISLVSGAGLSGTIAIAWAESEHRTICSSLVKNLRSMMAIVQGLKTRQSAFRDLVNHSHFLSVFLGEMKREFEAKLACPIAFAPSGELNDNPGTHPWPAQLERDTQIVLGPLEAEDFAEAWSGDIHELLWGTDVNCYFSAFDTRPVRTAFAAAARKPPASLAGPAPAELDGAESRENSSPSCTRTVAMWNG